LVDSWHELGELVIGTLRLTSGRVHRARVTTISFTVTRPTWRYRSPRDYRTGTRRCWTRPSLSAVSLTTRYFNIISINLAVS